MWLLWLSTAVTTLPTFHHKQLHHHHQPVVLIANPLYEIRISNRSTAAVMSWAGFKKNVNRATTQVMMKTGHVEKTNDRDYEVEER
jgi:hypothetical protein